MTQDVTSLIVRIESLEAKVASDRLNKLAKSGAKAEKSSDKLTAGFGRMIGPLVAVVSATSALTKLVSEGRSFAIMSAQLETATGSAEAASKQFAKLEEFAAETPFLLQQSVDAFTKLTNLGLDPSRESMISYGNTASAMGKDLNQMIEAVADAATGEFERLKEFGIKSKSQGDNVSFTFRGITTTVKKNAAEIEGYLKDIGENEFAGAMAKRMATLDGAISNLEDTWDSLFRSVLKSGVGNLIEDGFRGATDALEYFMEVTGLADDMPTVFNETADAAIRYASAQENIANLAEAAAGKESSLLAVIKKIESARDNQIEIASRNQTSEAALSAIREGFAKKYQTQIDGITSALEASSVINSELMNKEIEKRNEAKAAIDAYVIANEEKDKALSGPVVVEFDETIGADSFTARIELLQDHNLLVREIVAEHNRLVEEDDERSATARMNTIKSLTAATLSSARSLGDNLSSVMKAAGREQSAIAKTIFLAQKAIDVVTIISSTEVAAAKAAAVAAAGGPVSFFATAGAIRAFGYANAAIVAGLGVNSALSSGFSSGGGSSGGAAGVSSSGSNLPASPETLQQREAQEQQPIIINLNISDEVSAQIIKVGMPVAVGNDYVVLEKDDNSNTIRVVA